MDKYINVKDINYFCIPSRNMSVEKVVLKKDIDKIPPADVEPVRHGRWKRIQWVTDDREQAGGYWISRCSSCRVPYNEEKQYCPNCGAKMDEKENDK